MARRREAEVRKRTRERLAQAFQDEERQEEEARRKAEEARRKRQKKREAERAKVRDALAPYFAAELDEEDAAAAWEAARIEQGRELIRARDTLGVSLAKLAPLTGRSVNKLNDLISLAQAADTHHNSGEADTVSQELDGEDTGDEPPVTGDDDTDAVEVGHGDGYAVGVGHGDGYAVGVGAAITNAAGTVDHDPQLVAAGASLNASGWDS